MGTPVPLPIDVPPVPPGDPCTTCWGTGKPFGDIDTPSEIPAIVSGINKGPNWSGSAGVPPNGERLFIQDPNFPCRYSADFDVWFVRMVFGSVFEGCSLTRLGFITAFFSRVPDACRELYTNEENDKFVGGTVQIFLPETI